MTENSPTPPTVSIYQNPDHVAGILQQVFGQPLVEAEHRERANESTSAKQKNRGADGALKGRGGLPGVGGVEAGFGGRLSRSLAEGQGSASRVVQDFTYSQAYYLYRARGALSERGQLKQITSAGDADNLCVGDFVEFAATFRANEMTALLDILTPDLLAEIAYYVTRSDGIKKFDAYDNYADLKIFAEKNEIAARLRAELAREVARAVRVDFRAEKTREFYGSIGQTAEQVTAITMCDAAHFVVQDEDRILDGHWTVLGKVTSALAENVPILERNKVLARLRPEGIDQLLTELRHAVDQQSDKLPGHDTDAYEDLFNLAFSSRISGRSFKVVPIAVYV